MELAYIADIPASMSAGEVQSPVAMEVEVGVLSSGPVKKPE